MVGIQYAAFSDWLFSLSNIHLSFLMFFLWLLSAKYKVCQKVNLDFPVQCYGKTWTNFLAIPIVFHCLDVPQFVHSPAAVHLGCFQVLATMNKVAVNICVLVFVWMWVLAPCINVKECSCWVVCKNMQKPTSLSSKVTHHFASLPARYESSCCSTH